MVNVTVLSCDMHAMSIRPENSRTLNAPQDVDIDTEIVIANAFLEDMEARQIARRSTNSLPNSTSYLHSQTESLRKFLRHLQEQLLQPGSSSGSSPNNGCKPAASEDGRILMGKLALLAESELDDHRTARALEQDGPLPCRTTAQQALGNGLFLDSPQPANDPSQKQSPAVSRATSAGLWSAGFFPFPIGSSQKVECVVCNDQFDDKACFHAPCSHHFCRPCVNRMAEAAVRDEGLMPLQCCYKQLPLEQFEVFLPTTSRAAFHAKAAELSIPPPQRLYCPNKKCSTFLGRSSGEAIQPSTITCQHCKTVACSKCKKTSHPRENCSDNALTLELRELAATKHWQTCPGCQSIVERMSGCRHMSCRCSTEFCYRCGRRWRVCQGRCES